MLDPSVVVITCGRYIGTQECGPVYIVLHLFMYASLPADYVSHCNTADTYSTRVICYVLIVGKYSQSQFSRKLLKDCPFITRRGIKLLIQLNSECGVKLNFLLTRQDADVKGNQRDYSSVCARLFL